MQAEHAVDDGRVDDEQRQEGLQAAQPVVQQLALKADDKRDDDRRGSGDEIVQDDQDLACRQSWYQSWHAFICADVPAGIYRLQRILAA